MYSVAVQRDLIAQHYLIGGDWGPENDRNSHHYRIEVCLEGETLDQHGYLVDIVEIEARLDAVVATYRDRTLNDLPAFAGLNPSVEHFARIVGETLITGLQAPTLSAIAIRIWENDRTWAGYRRSLPAG